MHKTSYTLKGECAASKRLGAGLGGNRDPGCIHVNGPGGRLIQPRITIHVTFARFSQCSDAGMLRITSRLA